MPFQTAGCFFVLAAATAFAQNDAPPGLLHSRFLGWSGTPRAGKVLFRDAQNHVFSCFFDQKTYIERSNQRVTFATADPGDRLELVTDHLTGCYLRMAQIVDKPMVPVKLVRPAPTMSVAGIVVRVFPDLLVLKLRKGDEEFLRLRPDTQFLEQGQASSAGSLRANTLVFIRAARNFYGEVEAYQVIWGQILSTDP